MQKEKILLDTDIGTDIDDALTLAYLLYQPKCELIGITTVTGQAFERAKMASAICIAAGRPEVPIHIGVEDCILVEQQEKYAPQSEMLKKWQHKDSFPKDAITYMIKTIRENPGEITLLGISPLGNIARLFLTDPEIPSLLKGLYLMCGKFSEWEFRPWSDARASWWKEPYCAFVPENFRFTAGGALEMNALIDPYATAIVYGAQVSKHKSIGVDMTCRVTLPSAQSLENCAMHSIFDPIVDMANVWFKTSNIVTFHDPLACACIFNNDVCEFMRGNVQVELQSDLLRGYTHFVKDDDGGCEIACTVSPESFFQEFYSVFKKTGS